MVRFMAAKLWIAAQWVVGAAVGLAFCAAVGGALVWPYRVVEDERVKRLHDYPFRDDPVGVLETDRRKYAYYYRVGDPWPLSFRGLKPGDTVQVVRHRNLYGYGIGLSAEPVLPEQRVPPWWYEKYPPK